MIKNVFLQNDKNNNYKKQTMIELNEIYNEDCLEGIKRIIANSRIEAKQRREAEKLPF